MNSDIFDCKGAAEYLGIGGKRPERAIQKMIQAKRIKALLTSRKHGYRIHRKALEDAVLLGGPHA